MAEGWIAEPVDYDPFEGKPKWVVEPVDYDPFAKERLPLAPTDAGPGTEPASKQGLYSAFGNALVQGGIQGTGQLIGGTGEAFQAGEKRATNRVIEAADAVDQGRPLAEVMQGLSQVERGLFAPYASSPPEERQRLRSNWGEVSQAAPNALTRAGEATTKYANRYPVSPEREGYLTGAARMAGAAVPAIGAAVAGTVAGGPPGGLLAAAATIYPQAFDQGLTEARRLGATPEQAIAAAGRNAAIQTATMVGPFGRILKLVPELLQAKFVQAAVKLGQSGVEFATANAFGQFAQNWVMRETVDPNHSLTEGIADNAIMGGIAGVMIPGAGVAGRGAARVARDAMSPPLAPEQRALLNAGEGLASRTEPQTQPDVTPEADALSTLQTIAGDQVIPLPPPITTGADNIPTMKITPEPAAEMPARPVEPDIGPEPPPIEAPPVQPVIEPTVAPQAPEPAPRPPDKPPDALSFLISKGGVQDTGGDIASMGGDAYHHRNAGRLVNPNGLPLDRAREALRDAGYLPQDADINSVLDVIGDSLSGRPRFPADFEAEAQAWREGQDAYADRERFTDRLNEVHGVAREAGIPLKGDEANHAAELMMEGASAADAVAEAVRAADLAVMQAYQAANGLLSARERSVAARTAQGAPSPAAAQAREQLATVMQALMRHFGLPSSVGVKLVDRLVDSSGNPADAAFTRSLLTVALDTPPEQIMNKLFHEITHGLMDPAFGALTPNQRNALLKAADRWLEQPGRRAELEELGYNPTQIREEAVARVAEEVLADARAPASLVRRGADAMRRAVEAVGSGLRGQGFTSADGVFRAVLQGKVRGKDVDGGSEPSLSRRPPLPPKEGEDLFGTTRAAPTQRTPEPTIRTDPRQAVMPGMEPSAVQAQAARDQTPLAWKGPQKPTYEGLFADRTEGQDRLFSRRSTEIDKTETPDALRALAERGDLISPRSFIDDMIASNAEDSAVITPRGLLYRLRLNRDEPYAHEPFYESILDDDNKFSKYAKVSGYGDAVGIHQDGPFTSEQMRIIDEMRRRYIRAGGRPENIYVTDGNGKLSRRPRNPRQGNLGIQSAFAPWSVSEPGNVDAIIRTIQNNKIDVKRLRDALQKRFNRMTDETDVYLNDTVYTGAVSDRLKLMTDQRVVPMLEKIAAAQKKHGITVDDVDLYLHARHAAERNAEMKRRNPDRVDNEALSGMSDADAAQVLADFAAKGKDKVLADIAGDVDRLTEYTREVIVKDGLEPANVIDGWRDQYQHYVPLQRDIEGGGTPRGKGINIRGRESRHAVGSTRKVVDILANVVGQAETAVIRAEKAKVGRSLLAMAKQYPNEAFWRVDEPPAEAKFNPKTGLVEIEVIDPRYQEADNVVMIKDDNAKPHFVVFNDQNERAVQVARALKNMDVAQLGPIMTVANHATRFMASLATSRNPDFLLTNLLRDVQGATFNMTGTQAAGQQAKFAASLPMAFAGMRAAVLGGKGGGKWEGYAREFMKAGGATGVMQMFGDSEARMKNIKREVARMNQGKADPRRMGRAILKTIDDYNTIIENGTRLAVFQAARENGASTKRAAQIAKEVTLDFNRKGNLTPLANTLYMFMNANIQGTARLIRAIKDSPTAKAAVGGMVAAGFLLDMGNRMMAGEDEETGRNLYDLIPEFEKSRNWIFMNPMRPGEWIKVPLPLGPHVFHNVGRLGSDFMNRKDARDASEYAWTAATTVLDAFNPLGSSGSIAQYMLPSLARPVIQLGENKSFTGAPLYKSEDRGFGNIDPNPAYTRFFENTPELWKDASRQLNSLTGGDSVKRGALNIEPDVIKHIFYTMTGGPGRILDKSIDMMREEGRSSPNRMPFVSRFYGETDDRQRDRAYLEDRKRAMKAKTDYDHYRKAGRMELADDVAKRLGRGDKDRGLAMIDAFVRSERGIRQVNKQIRQKEKADAPASEIKDLKGIRTDRRSDTLKQLGAP